MIAPRTGRGPRPNAGTVLLLTLMFLLLLGILAASVVQTATLQFRQAGNNLHLERALRQARAIALEVAQHRSNFDPGVEIGHTRCLPGSGLPRCDERNLAQPVATPLESGATLEVTVTRTAPLEVPLPGNPPTELANLYEVAVHVQGGVVGLGSARVAYGVALPLGPGIVRPVYWREPGVDAL